MSRLRVYFESSLSMRLTFRREVQGSSPFCCRTWRSQAMTSFRPPATAETGLSLRNTSLRLSPFHFGLVLPSLPFSVSVLVGSVRRSRRVAVLSLVYSRRVRENETTKTALLPTFRVYVQMPF